MINRIRIKNWRSHEGSELDFSKGTNALIGIMGSGKSTVMDSICFALFGTFPNLQSKKLKLDDILMSKPIQKDKADVELFLDINGKECSIRRIIERGKGTTYSEIKQDGKILESPNSIRVTEMVERILKINYELFSKAIYSEQNSLDYFLTMPKGQRMKKIDELLMINKFEIARANTISIANSIIDRKMGIQSVLGQMDWNELEKNIADLGQSLNSLAEDRDNLEVQLGSISSKKEFLERELQELKNIKESLDMLKRDEGAVEAALSEISDSLKILDQALKDKSRETVEESLVEISNRLDRLNEAMKEYKNRYDGVSSELNRSKAELDFLKNERIKNLEREIEERIEIRKEFEQMQSFVGENVFRQIDEKKQKFHRLLSEFHELNAEIKNINEVITKLSSIGGKCPICDSRLTDERKNLLIEQKSLEIEKLKKRLEESKRNKDICENDIVRLEESARRMDEMLKEIKELDSLNTELQNSRELFSELSEISIKTDNQLSEIRNKISELDRLIKDNLEKKQRLEFLYSQQKDYESKKSRFDDLIKHRKGLEVKIDELEVKLSGKNINEMEDELKKLIAYEKEIETKVKSSDELIKEKELRISEYEYKMNEFNKNKREIERLDELIKNLKIFGQALKETQIQLRKEFVGAVNYAMQDLWLTLYPYKDFIDIRLSVETGDYVLQLKEGSGRWVNVEGIASGGERSIAALALRIAFALVLAPQLKWLVLDEPTANLDSKAIRDFVETLKYKINDFVDQVFIITHNPEIEYAVTGSLYRLEREKEKDGCTKVLRVS